MFVRYLQLCNSPISTQYNSLSICGTSLWSLSVRLLTCSPVAPQVCNTDKSLSLPHNENDNHC
jgi:hypothetical protein